MPKCTYAQAERCIPCSLDVLCEVCFLSIAILCNCAQEGFAHYLHEALGLAQLVVAIDAPPINEVASECSTLVSPTTSCELCGLGWALQCGPSAVRNAWSVSPDQLLDGIQRALALSQREKSKLKQSARAAFESSATAFFDRIYAVYAIRASASRIQI